MKIVFPAVALIFLLASCGGGMKRKVIVYSNGTPTIAGNTITLSDKSSHNEVEMFPTDKTITVKFPDNVTQSFTVDGEGTDGLYILNLKKDT
jgi:type 1 fimbria pilin